MTVIHSRIIPFGMTTHETDQRRWLEAVLADNRLTATELARRAALDPSTLTRFLQGERDGHMLSARTVKKIEQAIGGSPARNALGFEDDAAPYDVGTAPPSSFRSAILALKAGRNGVDAWTVATDELAGIQLFRGDVLMVDLNADPQPGDIVCAQIYDWQEGRAKTVFRLNEPPYLLSGSSVGKSRRPEVVEGRNVVIRGVVIARLSSRTMLHAPPLQPAA